MLYTTLRTLMLAGALALAMLIPFLFQPDLTGTWHIELSNEAATETIVVAIEQQDSLLSGNYLGHYTAAELDGRLDGNAVTFTYAIDGIPVQHIGYLQGASLVGEYHAGEFDRGAFRGRKVR